MEHCWRDTPALAATEEGTGEGWRWWMEAMGSGSPAWKAPGRINEGREGGQLSRGKES